VTPNLAAGLTFSNLKGIAGPARAWIALRASSVESRFEALHAAALTPLVGREEEFELLQRRRREATGLRAPVTAGRYLVQIIHHRGKVGLVILKGLADQARSPVLCWAQSRRRPCPSNCD
jgi:hypothetical protein